MKNLVIIGAGGCGREVLQWAKDINKNSDRWNIKGFLDQPNALGGTRCDYEVLGTDEEYEICKDDEFICAIGSFDIRRRVTDKFRRRGAQFTNIIHPTAIIGDTSRIGEDCIIYPYTTISDNVMIDDDCIINTHCSLGHDVSVGKNSIISAHCDLVGHTKVGNNVFFGTSAHTVWNVKIGDKAFICAGSTVMSNVRSGVKVMGNPAKKVDF